MLTYRENFLYYYEKYTEDPRAYVGPGKYVKLTETEIIEKAYASADTIAKAERISARREKLSRSGFYR